MTAQAVHAGSFNNNISETPSVVNTSTENSAQPPANESVGAAPQSDNSGLMSIIKHAMGIKDNAPVDNPTQENYDNTINLGGNKNGI